MMLMNDDIERMQHYGDSHLKKRLLKNQVMSDYFHIWLKNGSIKRYIRNVTHICFMFEEFE